ncbi:TolC family protein [Fulvivirgaceae bacterium PWU4]|uniref:TolC family protein n=1 Tax=Chryseosolibacter histidini TaxID=2782349 RepID=A0AAP2DQV1_9BACT|nr:TolC family protein [Chryseosolibacter histidini]MBT1699327.1 TolC family protein [Chryseosolibacter histidini]
MRRIYLIILATMVSPVLIKAQQTETGQSQAAQQSQTGQAFTLEQCIQYALDNSANVKNAVIDEQIADARVKETRGIGLPQIDGSVTVQHNSKLPRFFATKQTAFGFSGETDYANFMPGVPDDGVVASRNFFQLPSSGNANLAINQLLFNSSYLVGLRAASTYRELSVKTTQQTKEQTIEKVIKAYYAVLINKDRMQLFDNNIERVESLLKTTSAMNTNGFAESIDVDRIKVTLNNLRAERDKFYKLQELGYELLKFQMTYPMDQPIAVTGDIASLNVSEDVLSTYSANWDYKERIDYSILETNQRLLELDLKNKYSTSLPSLSAFANLGYSTQSPNISGVFKTNTNIKDNGVTGPDKWYPAVSFGVSLNVPIFSGLQRNYRVQQAKLALQKVENNFTNLKSAIDLEVQQAATNYINAVTTLKSQDENKKLAENVARVTKIKYEQGVGSNIEVIDAESALKEAQINYYSALYDAVVARVDLEKAYGKLSPTPQENK